MTGRDATAARGQVVLVSVVLLATLLVGLALVVDGTISPEDRSTRGPTDAAGALVEASATLETVDELLDRSNANHHATHGNATRTFRSMVAAVATAQRSGSAEQGAHSHVAIVAQTNGTHVRQANDSRAFTDATGSDADWTVVRKARGVSDYRLTVQRDRLYTDLGDPLETVLEDSYTVHVSSTGGATWTLHVYENTDGEVAVRTVRDGAVQAPCTADAGAVRIDLVEGTVGGDPCSTLSFAHGLTGAVDVEYRNPDRGAGTYEFRVDRVLSPATDSRFATIGEGAPSATPNVYAATTRFTYHDADVVLVRELRHVAGEAVYG